jgi:plasmid stability protein
MEGRMAKTTVELPEGLHRTLRVTAALENRSMNEIVLTALRRYLQSIRIEPEVLEVDTVPAPHESAASRQSDRRRI